MPFNKSKVLEEATKLAGQRKFSQAIKQYLAIMENDPADLSLLNIVGDLYVREGNIPAALRQYYKLGAAYAHEGFSLKAIAIYKKIAKLDVHSVEPLIKLAELYSGQGLSREAREQYALALVFCQSHSLPEKAAAILGTLIAQDSEAATYRVRLGELHEAAGRAHEASLAYLDAAEIAYRHQDMPAANAAIGKALHLDPRNGKVALFAARMAVENGRVDDAAKLLDGCTPEIKASRGARLIRLELYLRAQKLDEAAAVAVETYREDPANFEAIERFTSSCLQANDPGAALALLGAVVDVALERQQTAPIAAILRNILQAQPHDVSSLELLHAIYERGGAARFGDELLEELGGAFAKAAEWTSAAKVYRQLLVHAGDNPTWQAHLSEALSHQDGGQETGTAESSPAAEPAAPPTTAESAPSPETVCAPAAGPEPDLGREPVPTSDAAFSPSPGPAGAVEVDFSSEWKEYSAASRTNEKMADSGPALALEEDEKAEIQFYLEYGFFGEAHARLENMETDRPGHPELAQLRKKLEEAEGAGPPPSSAAAAPKGVVETPASSGLPAAEQKGSA
ncbi:MAG: tetratricopeptide repeat protein, partial [Terriglobia bacterium]